MKNAALWLAAFLPASWAPVPMERIVCAAEVIVAGRLSKVHERYLSVVFHDEKPGYTDSYDRGRIVDAEVLKSDGVAQAEHGVSVIFDSSGQEGHPFAHMKIPRAAGETGIWLLNRDLMSGHYLISGPANPVPVSKRDAILRALRETDCASQPAG